MNCPYCGSANLEGNDLCANCGRELMADDVPLPTRGLQARLMTEQTGVLGGAAPMVVSDDVAVAFAINVMRDRNIGCVLVTRDRKLVGIFTERDVLLKVAGREEATMRLPVRDLMSENPETLRSEDPLRYALHKMSVGEFRHVPIALAGEAIGVVSSRDILDYLAARLASPDPAETAIVEST